MKNLITATILVGGALMASQPALAQVSLISDDLYMGFENQVGGGTADYIINLGPASGIVGSSSVVNLSSDFSLSSFNSVLGASSSMFGGVVAASNGNPPNLYATQLRSGGAGIPSVPGSTSPGTFYKGDILLGYSDLGQLYHLPAAGTGVLDTSKSWENYVEPANANGTFYGDMGFSPDSPVGPTTVLYEDLWYVSNNSQSVKITFHLCGLLHAESYRWQPESDFHADQCSRAAHKPGHRVSRQDGEHGYGDFQQRGTDPHLSIAIHRQPESHQLEQCGQFGGGRRHAGDKYRHQRDRLTAVLSGSGAVTSFFKI